MPPASLAHFKHRVPSGSGTGNEPNLPPPKRARETALVAVGVGRGSPLERVGVPGRGAPLEDAEKKSVVARGNTPPDEKVQRFLRGKTTTEAESSVARGNYDISDPETLDCTICNNPLFLPVYQCRNGHTACPTCWSNFAKAKRTCHSCPETQWDIRCLVLEKVLEHLSVRCSHASFGCNDFLKFLKKKDHEEVLCKYRPFKCPIDGCTYEGPKPALLQHFDKRHQMQAVQIDKPSRKAAFVMNCTEKYKLVQSEQELYVVYHETMAGAEGDIFYCAAFGPYGRSYVLKVELRTESRYHVLRTLVPEIKYLDTWRRKRDHLVVPNNVQMEPRSNCHFDLELEFYGSIVQAPGRLPQ